MTKLDVGGSMYILMYWIMIKRKNQLETKTGKWI